MSNGEPRKLAWWKAALLSVGGGLLTSLAFPPVDVSGLVWVGLLPLLTALWLGPAGKWRGFVMGWLYGMGYLGSCFHWINELSPLWDIPLPLFLAVAYIPLISIYSCLPGLWGLFAATLLRPALQPAPDTTDASVEERKDTWRFWLMGDILSTLRCAAGLGALWACTEWMRAYGPMGCGWNAFPMAMFEGLSLVQWAEFVGSHTLSILPVAVNVILWCAGRRIYIHFKGTRSICRPWDFYGMVGLLFMLFMGGLTLSKANSPAGMMERESVMRLPVVALQLNTNQRERLDIMMNGTAPMDEIMAYRRQLTADCLTLTAEAFQGIQKETFELAMKHEGQEVLQQLPAWVVWPESALGMPIWRNERTGAFPPTGYTGALVNALEELRDVTASMGGPRFVLFAGGDEYLFNPETDEGTAIRNSMFCIPGDATTIRSAAKQHLLPFGEYIPFVEDIEFIGKAYSAVTGTAVGDGIQPGTDKDPLEVPVPGTGETVQVIPAVCYEETVSPQVRQFVRPGAQVIVNVSNDAWFGESCCGIEQARAAAFRCIELRRPMVRAANGGLCCTIAPNGAFISTLTKDGSPHTAGYTYAILPVDRKAGLTLYAFIGDWIIVLCLLAGIGLSIPGMKIFRKD